MKRNWKKYNLARKLRQEGNSIRSIKKTLYISSSSASLWCRDIDLSQDQKSKLISNQKEKNTTLLKNFAHSRHEYCTKKRLELISQAQRDIQKLTSQELFLVGVALYWAEGFKSIKERRIGFCNSDPQMILFMMRWFRESLKIPEQDFTLRAEFNISHIIKKAEIEYYWSQLTRIPLSQFNKPYIQTVNQVRDYSSRGEYFGLLRIRIRKSSELLEKLRGWIKGLSISII